MTHALAAEPLLLPVVLLALVAEALSVVLRRPAPRLLRGCHRAGRRAVEVPSVARAAEEKLSVTSGAGATPQLLHEPLSPPPKLDTGSPGVASTMSGTALRASSHAARSWNLRAAPLCGYLRDYDRDSRSGKKLPAGPRVIPRTPRSGTRAFGRSLPLKPTTQPWSMGGTASRES